MNRLIATLLTATLALGSTGCLPHVVEAGTVGVQMTWGQVDQTVHPEGLYWVQLLREEMVDYDVRIQKLEARASASSRDLQVVTTHVAVNYRVDGAHAAAVYQDVGRLAEVEVRIMEPALQEAVKKTTAQFTAEELITRRQAVKEGIHSALESTVAALHIEITELSITDFKFEKNYQDAVESKQVAEQTALTAKNDLVRIQIEAEQAEAAARGRANALLIEAQAEASAQELLRETLTDEIVQLRAVEKWDGVMPVVSSDAGAFVDLGALGGKKGGR